MIYAGILAGGTGTRMGISNLPKQFLELHGKPIIIHTLEHFENHTLIDAIVVVCIEEWIDYLNKLLVKFQINKVIKVVPGGKTGQMSIYNGLNVIHQSEFRNDIVLIHDGVRPLINAETITNNIECVRKNGSAITVKPVIETVIQVDDEHNIVDVVERSNCQTAVAPQGFFFNDIYEAHLKAQSEEMFDFTDSATLMRYYGFKLNTVMGGSENIKITTPSDFYIFRAIYELRENAQILG